MNTSRLNHHVRHNWEIVFLLLLILAVFCVAGGLLVQRVSNVSVYKFLPVALDSVLATDYGIDPNPTRRPPLRLDIIWDTLHDHDPDAEDLAERMAALMNRLQTPVPVVTPQLCQGIHVIYASRDTWLDSARPTDINGSETTLRLGFSDTGRKRPLLYFPVSDRIPPGTFAGRARLELELPPDTPAAVPGSVCFFNLDSGFDETGTNWSNQPETDLPYCSQAISAAKNLHTWDVTGLVNDWLQGHYPNSGLMIDLASPAAIEPVYFSREAAGLANFQTSDPARQVGPRLVIDCGGPLPAPEAGEIAQVPPTAAPGLPAATGTPQPPAVAATSTAPAGSPPPVSATPVIPPTGTRAATVTAPAFTPTRPAVTGSPTPATTPTRPVATGSPTPATTSTRPVATGSPTPATVAPTPVAPSPTVPPATSTSPPEPTSKPPTSTPTATPVPTSTPSPTATATASPTATAVPQADLVISKSASTDPVIAGDNLTYILDIRNNGPAVATGVAVTDSLPPAVSLVSAISSQGACTGTGLLACNLGDISPGGAASITVVVGVSSAATGSLANSATVSAGPADPNPANNTGTAVTTISRSADLVISKSDSPDPVTAGNTLTYTLAITNNGPSTATGVVFTDTLPAGVAFASAPAGCGHNAGLVTCDAGSLASGGSRTYQVTVAVDPAASGTLINSATVTGSETDPVSNNTSTIGTTVTAEADLAVSKSVDNAAPLEQDQVLYTVTVANGGPSHATGVVISDPLPVGLAYVSDNSGGSYNSGSGLWTVGNLDGSASVTLLITATVNTETAGKTITNTALISTSDQPDPDPGNDTASVIITPALPALSIGDVTVTEGDSGTTAAIFTVTLSAAVTQTVTVNYGTADNTATLADNDYNAVGGTLTFSPGVTTQTVTVQVNGDTTLESNESFFVNLSDPAGAGIAAGQGKGTILDDDSLSTITLTDVWDAWMEKNNPGNTHGNEDNMQVKPPNQEYRILINFHTLTTALPAGSTVLAATLHLYQDGVRTGQAISIYPLTTNWVEGEVKWSKAANGPGGDWVNPAGGGDFDTGTTWATFDPATGGHRYINITGLVQAWATGAYDNYGMILTSTSSGPDDGAVKFYTHEHATSAWRPSLEITYTSGSVSQLSLSIGNVTVSEGDSGTTPAVFNVTLSGASTQTVTVDYATADNTATTADNDYVAANGTLTFAPGVTQQPITVTVIGDTKPENSQSFFVNLSNPQNAVIANGQGLGTIVQDVGGLSLPEGGGDRRLYLPVIVKPGN